MGLWFVANLLETLALTPFFWPEGPGHLKQLRFVWQCSEKWPERCGIIVSACRGLMELGGRLIECLPSFYLKCRNSATIPTTTTLICGQSLGDIGLDTFLLAWRAWSFETTQIRLAVQWKMAGKVWNHIYIYTYDIRIIWNDSPGKSYHRIKSSAWLRRVVSILPYHPCGWFRDFVVESSCQGFGEWAKTVGNLGWPDIDGGSSLGSDPWLRNGCKSLI